MIRAFPNPAAGSEFQITLPPLTITCTTAGSTTLTSSAAFGSVFVGMKVMGQGIPDGTTVTAIASASSLTMSQAATDSTAASRKFVDPIIGGRLKSVHFLYSTANAASARSTKLRIDNGTNVIATIGDEVGQSIATNCEYNYGAGCVGAAAFAAGATVRYYPLPDILLGANFRIGSISSAIDAGDQYAQITISVE